MALMDEARRRGLIGQIPTGGMQAPAADGSQNNPLNTDLGRNVTNTLGALPGAAGVPGAAAAVGGLAARALGTSAPALTAAGQLAQRAAPYAPVAGGAAALQSASSPASTPSSPAPQGLAAAAGLVPGSGRASPTPPATPSLAGPPMSASGSITRDGNSYSGAPNISGDVTLRNPDGSVRPSGGAVSAQNMQAADNLVSRQGLAAYAGLVPGGTGRPNGTVGNPLMQAAGLQPGFSGVIGQQSGNGNMWSRTPEQQRRDAEVQASSIHRQTAANGMAALRGLDAQDLAATRAQGDIQQEGIRQAGALQREGMQQQGLNVRSALANAVDRIRADAEASRIGSQNRESALMQRVREEIATEPDQTRRTALGQRLREIMGQAQPADPYLVVPGGQQVDPGSGKAYNTPSTVFNRQTGQFVQQPQGQGATQQSPYPDGQELIGKDGKTYVVKNGVPVAK